MNVLKITFLLSIISVCISCKDYNNQIQGTWKFVHDQGCNINFLGLDAFIYPHAQYGHKIYISDSLIYSPYFKDQELPFEQKYTIKDSLIALNRVGKINVMVDDSTLILTQDECSLIFNRYASYETIQKNSLSQISLETRNGNDLLIDSVSFSRSIKNEYLFRLAESIELRHVNDVFDEGVVDSYEYRIILKRSDGNVYNITSYDKYRTPFEVITLLKYLKSRDGID